MAGQGYAPVRSPHHSASYRQPRRQPPRHSTDILTPTQVANADDNDHLSSAPIPNSPPPSFRSNDSSPRNSHAAHRRTPSNPRDDLADAFDGSGSDTEEENDGDDRQRLMRGTPSATAASGSVTPSSAEAQTDGAIQLTETSQVARPVGQAPIQGRVYGGGSGDGVFANLSAKPERAEKLVEEFPPVSTLYPSLIFCSNILTYLKTYEAAAADAAPPYWETTILTPGSYDPNEVYIDGLPVGSFFSFIWNATISMSFQLVGFLLTYLLHTTHAAKNGSRAGLGVTLIQYGWYLRNTEDIVPGGEVTPENPDGHEWDASKGEFSDGGGEGDGGISGQEWMAYALMVLGWFMLIRSIGEYVRARRTEQLILQAPDRGLGVPIIAEGEGERAV